MSEAYQEFHDDTDMSEAYQEFHDDTDMSEAYQESHDGTDPVDNSDAQPASNHLNLVANQQLSNITYIVIGCSCKIDWLYN